MRVLVSVEARGLRCPEAGVRGSCLLPNMGAENQIYVYWKSSMCCTISLVNQFSLRFYFVFSENKIQNTSCLFSC